MDALCCCLRKERGGDYVRPPVDGLNAPSDLALKLYLPTVTVVYNLVHTPS